jgi:hypothetical protein
VGQVTVSVALEAGITDSIHSDAVRLPLNVQPLAIPDVYTQVGDFPGSWSTLLAVPEPALASSSVQVRLSRSPAGSVLQGLEYLTGYPYGCVEQTMSRALPNAVVGRALYKLGVEDPTLQNSLPELVGAGLQRLYGYQHDDGGWGWWYDDPSHPYQTAWVIFGLAVTAEAGYAVDPGVIERGASYLSGLLPDLDQRTRAYALYSLAAAGYGDPGTALDLADTAPELDPFSQAALALALDILGEREQALAILEILADTAESDTQEGNVQEIFWPRLEEDGHYYQKTMASTTRSTALALDAFTRLAPDHPLIPGMVRYLMSARRANGWGSTNETAFSILALTDHLLAVNEASPDMVFYLELNGQEILTGTLGQKALTTSLILPADHLLRGVNELRISQEGAGRLYYVINSRMLLPEGEIEPAGPVEVTRQYLDPKTQAPADRLVPGQLVQVRLTVILAQDASFLIVEDKLPGGLEALNERLNNTSHDAAAMDNDYAGPRLFWQEYGYNAKEVHSDRVSFFITEKNKGTFTLTYLARVTRLGTFTALPAETYGMYDEQLWGRSGSAVFIVDPDAATPALPRQPEPKQKPEDYE